MPINLPSFLRDPARKWHRAQAADEKAVRAFETKSPFPPPPELLEMWRFSNGGETEDIALPPRLFMLDTVELATAALDGDFEKEEFPGIVFFGSNGGLERIGLDYRSGARPSVVMIDPIAGLESASTIATDFQEFLQGFGRPYEEEG